LNGAELKLPKKTSATSSRNLAAGEIQAEAEAVGTESFVQDAGEIDLGPVDHPSTITGDLSLMGGTLGGNGTINGDLFNLGGFVSPGHSVGVIEVNGNYTQGAQGTLIAEVAGPNSTPSIDQLRVSGTASLAGTLHVRPIGGFIPQTNNPLVPLTYGAVMGAFDSVSANSQVTLNPTGAVANVNGAVPPPKTGQALNISTRMRVETGDNVLIAGFIVTGSVPKKVIIRGIGPSLPVSGALVDPTLSLDNGAVTNDDWRSNQEEAIIASTIPPSSNLESAIVATLNPGTHTAILRGKNNGTGVGLVEVYDLDRDAPAQLANISSRGFVQTGDNVMIGGFIVGGNEPAKVILRAIGPSLPVPGKLADPTLELFDSNGNSISNDNWRATQEEEIIASTVPPPNDNEAAIVATLVPGGYTAIVRGKNESTGIAVVEGYRL
ncbi:MAG: hypothetical protein M3Q89_13710, partial [Verrucomicrobiota bacterium]|nr:hypothetical protein [Verrucomicrobiota bacterium]